MDKNLAIEGVIKVEKKPYHTLITLKSGTKLKMFKNDRWKITRKRKLDVDSNRQSC